MTVYADTLTDGIRVNRRGDDAAWHAYVGGFAVMEDIIIVRPRPSYLYRARAIVGERVNLAVRYTAVGAYNLGFHEKLIVSTRVQRQLRLVLRSGFAVDDTLVSALAIRFSDALAISASIAGAGTYKTHARDGFTLSDYTTFGSMVSMRDGLAIGDDPTARLRAMAHAHETVALIEDVVGRVRLLVDLADDIEISDHQAITTLYHALLQDGIAMQGVADPGQNYTSWAMNARSGEVSSYSNFAFNSFAKLGDRWIAASADGLFELVGDADQTTPIQVRIAGGQVQLTGTHLGAIKAAYIATRGDGVVYLKLKGSGQTTTYRVTTRSMRTRRVELGKGWRTRYLAWELVTVGQDIDLLGLTFLPLPAVRRV